MATKSTKGSEKTKAQKPRMEVRDLKPRKDAKGGNILKTGSNASNAIIGNVK